MKPWRGGRGHQTHAKERKFRERQKKQVVVFEIRNPHGGVGSAGKGQNERNETDTPDVLLHFLWIAKKNS